jgi:GTP-binding protein
MPQTRFVTKKALALGLKPIVVINKIDRPGSRSDWVVDQTFDLFDKLGATEEQLDFPVVYASALNGFATLDKNNVTDNMDALFETILNYVKAPEADIDAPLQLQISALDYSSFVGRIGIGRIRQGKIKPNQQVILAAGADGGRINAKINQVQMFNGLERVNVDEASAGDIVLINGIEEVSIGETICDINDPQPLPMLVIDEPTLSMTFCVNTSPLAGTEGKFVTSRQIRDRLNKELLTNVALRVEDTASADVFLVSGRGELHLTILLENMRREGYELAVAKPYVVTKMIDGEKCEPYELLTVDIEEEHQGAIMEELGRRRGELVDMSSDSNGRSRLEYRIPARGLIGFQGDFLTLTRGTGLMAHLFDNYGPIKADIPGRRNGVLISQENGEAVAYALWGIQDRGVIFIKPQQKVYAGMIIGENSKQGDLEVNVLRGKQLTNIRAAGADEAIRLTPPRELTLEDMITYISDDELVEVTPKSLRLRKKILDPNERKRLGRSKEAKFDFVSEE